jgi:hypothetical protein
MSLDLSSGPLQFDHKRARRFKAGPVTKACIVIFMLVVFWLVAGGFSIQGFKTWLARREARAVIQAVREERWAAAIEGIISARKLAPDDPEVLRAMIDFLKQTGSDRVTLAQLLRQLGDQEDLRLDDRLLWADTLLATGDASGARQVFEKIPLETRETAESLQIAAKLVTAEGRPDEAREINRRITQLAPESPESRLALALEDRSSPSGEKRDAARATLWDLARLGSRIALEAITHLTIDPRLTVAETEELLAINERHPHRSLPVRLGVISAQARLQPARREQLLDAEIARFQSGGGGPLEDIARWLALEKQHARLLRIVPGTLASRSRELYPIIAQSLAEEGRWSELKEMLTASKPPVSRIRADIWLAEAESHLQKDLAESRRLLETCVEAARLEKDVSNLLASVVLAEKLQLPDIALNACQLIAAMHPPSAVEALQRAQGHAATLQDTAALLGIARQLHALRPSSALFASQLAYFRLLLGDEMEKVDPASLKDDTLLAALAAFRFGDRETLARHMAGAPAGQDLAAGQRAVLAGLLATSGRPAEAFQIAEKVPAALLLDEERSFLERAQ